MTSHWKSAIHPHVEQQGTTVPLPWWTWVLPFFIANLGTWLSLWFKTGPGASLWYLPTAFGLVMAYWWGPRVLLGVYLNAVLCAPLWDLPRQWSLLYALPETVEVWLSWFLFIKVMRGKFWLPDLGNVALFLFFGSLAPTFITNVYLVAQLYGLGDIAANTIWSTWRILFSADLATQLIFAVPALILFSGWVMKKGWSQSKENLRRLPFLVHNRNSALDILLIAGVFILSLALLTIASGGELWSVYGFLMIVLAVRYGINMAVIGTTWIGLLSLLLPILLKRSIGSSTGDTSVFLITNFDILFLCGITLITGRVVSDLFTEVAEHQQVQENLRQAETKYRTLAEQIPPIIYITEPGQHIGVVYISPRITSLGFNQEEWVADPELWLRRIHPDDKEHVLSDIQESMESNEPFRSEYRLIAKDGTIHWMLDEVVDVVDKDRKLTYRQGFMLDITERKTAEEGLSSREQYLALLNDMTQSILLSNDSDSVFQILAADMKKIINADDCYILRWNDEKQQAIPMATTARLDFSFSDAVVNEDQVGITSAVLKFGRALIIEDITNTSYIDREIAEQFPARSIMSIPLIAGHHKLGAAIIAFHDHHVFTREEIERAEQAGKQVALALSSFQQSVEIQQQLKQSHTLNTIGRTLSEIEHVGSDRVLQLIVDSALDLISQAEQSVIHIVDVEENVLRPMAIAGFANGAKENLQLKMQIGEGVAGQVLKEGRAINIPDVNNDPRFLLRRDRPPAFQSLMVTPIQNGRQQIGTISVQSRGTRAFSKQDEDLLNALATDAMIALDNTRTFEETQQRLKEVNSLYGTIKVLAASLDPQELVNDVVALLQQNFGFYYVQLFLVDPENNDLVLRAGSGEVGKLLMEDQRRLERGTGIIGHVVETGVPFVTNNVNDIVFFKRHPLLPDTQYELAVPIKIGQDIVGVMDIQDKPPRRLTHEDLQLVTAVADQLSVALQKANLFTDLQHAMKQEQTIRSQLLQSERLALVGRLLASVSHELNNPLQAIQNALFLLKEENGISSQGRQDLAIVLSETERMAALIERLRSAYRPIRGKDFQPVQLNSLIEDVFALIGTHMRHKDIAFEFIPDPELEPVSGISDQLRQVVLNLFLNAIEVMRPGGHLTVQTQNLMEQNEVYFSVKDSGPGIEDEILPQIFDAFITSKHTGTGLGLTITHDILQQHRGRIRAENHPDGGAIFHVWLPMCEKE